MLSRPFNGGVVGRALAGAAKAWHPTRTGHQQPERESEPDWHYHCCAEAIAFGTTPSLDELFLAVKPLLRVIGDTKPAAEWVRCIFGNPFRPATVNAAWLTPTAVDLAETIYTERAFDRLPILADALEEAGWDNRHVLEHCRGPGPHVKGCFVVDLLTGRE